MTTGYIFEVTVNCKIVEVANNKKKHSRSADNKRWIVRQRYTHSNYNGQCGNGMGNKDTKGKGLFYIARYPVRWTAQRALHFPPLADLFIPTPSRLLLAAF